MSSNSNVEILQRFQNRYIRIIVKASWYVINDVPYVRGEIKKLSQIGWRNILTYLRLTL